MSMPRQVRIQYPGALYHVMAGGDRREAIYRDDEDRKMFLAALEVFREKLLALADEVLRAGGRQQNTRSDEAVREHSEERAEALVKAGLMVCGLGEEDLAGLPRGDERKAVIALVVKRETTVMLDWIAQRLSMGARSTVSREVDALAKGLAGSQKLSELVDAIQKECQ